MVPWLFNPACKVSPVGRDTTRATFFCSKYNTVYRLLVLIAIGILVSLPFHSPNAQTAMKWKKKKNLPVAMHAHHIVRIGNDVYCGGGFTGKVSKDRLVYKYDHREDKWSQLSICPCLHFGLTQLNGKLVTVGGRDTDALTPIKDVYRFEEDSKTWKNKPLSEARCSPCVFAYKSVLVASGGINRWKFDYEHSSRTNSVEVFQDSQWYKSVPLPFVLSAMSCAIVNDTCYIIGGTKTGGLPSRQVCFISIPSLIPPESTSEASSSSPKWEHRNCPLFFSTAAELGGNLLAIGGKDDRNHPSQTVHRYLPSTDS